MPENKKTAGSKSVSKALYLLSFFNEKHSSWGVRELAAESGIDPATVYRLLLPFVQNDFLEQDSLTKNYRLGVQFIRYANMVEDRLDIVVKAQPIMQELVRKEHGTANISLFAGEHVYHKLEVSFEEELQVVIRHAESDCLHRTANGRMILSTWSKNDVLEYIKQHDDPRFRYPHPEDIDRFQEELENWKNLGYAWASAFLRFPDVIAIAAPVCNAYGKMIAGLSYYEIIKDNEQERITYLGEKLKEAASRLEHSMGWNYTGK